MIVLLAVMLGDLIWSPLTDPTARRSGGYGSNRTREGVSPPVRFGPRRVLHNFRNFAVFWRPPAGRRRKSGLTGFLTADGNSLTTNLFGHFGLAVLLCLIFLGLGANWTWVAAGATLVNIWHEYVSEGMYCDPSYVDLWLDQAGIGFALAGFALFRLLRNWRQQG
ncbi:MAG: hypothetical protein GXP31_19220 [Kiritimatiellaeota bacterium]|nr:hypothetical protein [Kiritimatiellota bacterium]